MLDCLLSDAILSLLPPFLFFVSLRVVRGGTVYCMPDSRSCGLIAESCDQNPQSCHQSRCAVNPENNLPEKSRERKKFPAPSVNHNLRAEAPLVRDLD